LEWYKTTRRPEARARFAEGGRADAAAPLSTNQELAGSTLYQPELNKPGFSGCRRLDQLPG